MPPFLVGGEHRPFGEPAQGCAVHGGTAAGEDARTCPLWYDDPRPCAVHPHDFSVATPVQTLIDGLQRVPPGVFVLVCALLSAAFAVVISQRYNHVLVVHRRIHTSAISNTWWIVYFAATAIQSSLHLARVICSLPGSTADVAMYYLQMSTRGVALAFLCVAIDYQIRHRSKPRWDRAEWLLLRSSVGSVTAINGGPDTKLLLRSNLSTPSESELYVRRARVYYAAGTVGLFVSLTSLVVDACMRHWSEELQWVYLGSTWLVLLVLLHLALVVVFTEGNVDDGPSLTDKLALVLGVVLSMIYDGLPPSGWKWLLPEGCELSFLSWYNIVEIVKIAAYVFLFIFMRQEFRRSKEACIHMTVGHIRNTVQRQNRY